MKRCKKCGENKNYDCFSRKVGAKDGLNGYCKSCVSAYNAVYSAKNRGRAAERSRERDLRETEELDDRYIKKQLIQGTQLLSSDIPNWMVEAKREQLRLKRELRK